MTFFRLLTALFLCSVPVWAQNSAPTPTPTPTGPIQMSVGSPLALTEKPLTLTGRFGRWFPISATLSNTGDAVTGELRLRLTTDSQFGAQPNEFYCPVELPTNSKKQIWLYGRIERQEITGVEISFSGRGFRSLSFRAPLQALDPSQRLILTVTDSNERLAYLSGLRGPGLAVGRQENPILGGGGQTPLRPIGAAREQVPDRWIGLEAVDLVVLGDFPHASLTPPQISALRGYAQGGGNLLVPAGANWQRLASSPLADLWPLAPSASVAASGNEVAGLVGRYLDRPRDGADRLGGAPVVVTRGTLKNGAVLKDGDARNPLFALAETGAGRCLFLSYDPTQPPFIGWRGLAGLWRDVLAQTTRARRLEGVDANVGMVDGNFNGGMNQPYGGYNNGQEDGITPTTTLLEALAKAPQLRMPPVGQIAWFLALYVFFLVPVNYAVLRYFDRRELAWVTIPAIVAAFSLFAYSTALSIRGRAILTRQVDIVQSSLGSSGGRADTVFWIFSPKKTTYDVAAGGVQSAVSDYAQGTPSSFSVLQPTDGSSFVAQRAGVLMWADRNFAAQSLVDLGKGVTLNGQTLKNGTPFDLKGAVLVADGAVTKIGEIPAQKSAPLGKSDGLQNVSPDLTGRILSGLDSAKVFDAATRTNNIPQAALSAALGNDWGKLNGQSLLIAWSDKPAAPISIGSTSPRSRDVTLFIFRIPDTARRTARREGQVSLASWTPGDNAIFACVAPPATNLLLEVRGVGLGSSTFGWSRGTRTASNVPLQFTALDEQSKSWMTLDGALRRDNSPVGGWNFAASLPRHFARRPDGTVQIRISGIGNESSISSVRLKADGS